MRNTKSEVSLTIELQVQRCLAGVQESCGTRQAVSVRAPVEVAPLLEEEVIAEAGRLEAAVARCLCDRGAGRRRARGLRSDWCGGLGRRFLCSGFIRIGAR